MNLFQYLIIFSHTVPSITTDGQFLYVHYPASGSLVKLGTGEMGTLKGFCYTQSSAEFEPGFLVWARGTLFYRKLSADVVNDSKQSSSQQQQQPPLSPFCHKIDHCTLQVTNDYISTLTITCFPSWTAVQNVMYCCVVRIPILVEVLNGLYLNL